MRSLLPLPIVLPMLGAALSILVGRSRRLQRLIGLTTLTAVTAISVAIAVEVDRHGPLVTQGGGWEAPHGITLVADRLTGIMLVVASVMLLAVLVYAIGQPGAERNHVGFQSVYLLLAAGVSGSFLAGDLFNMFVSFEMMLTASYVLITLGGTLRQVRAGMTYVVISLLASILFLSTLAFTYAATGTVNLADLAGRIGELPDHTQTMLASMMVVVFGIKAALFPLFFWLPDSYPTAPSPVTAIFAGLLTKVGVYAIVRTQTLLFPGDSRPADVLLVLASLTMVIGVLGAIAQDDVKRILSFNIVSHIGYMVLGLALFTVAGVAAAVFYTVHHIVAKTCLFLTGGLIEHAGGSSRLSKLGDMARTAPLIAVLFLVPALSLVGIPPFSGFVAKLALVDASMAADEHAVAGIAIFVSLLTLFSMMKIWSGVFWSPAEDTTPDEDGEVRLSERSPMRATERQRGSGQSRSAWPGNAMTARFGAPVLMVVPTAVLAVTIVVIGVAAGPLFELCRRAATDLLDPSAYVQAVLGT